ncbi:MAG TPA: hypothetical protein VMV44_08525 [Rectinemataceae bacterium]|nr:hypothetical protein [Rectinemataceae bacterium]
MDDDIELSIDPALDKPPRLAIVWARGLAIAGGASPGRGSPGPTLAALLERVRAAGEAWLTPARKAAVRDMLRHGVYKPAGRAKPSSEYLLAAALEGSFPFVNGAVDANNAASLAYGYPASVFDLEKCGKRLLLKRGGPGDSYVFNASGQEIDLEDLLCLWKAEAEGLWSPIGNPVKDAMGTKVFETCGSIVAVVYAPSGPEGRDLEACAELFAGLLRSDCGAATASWRLA